MQFFISEDITYVSNFSKDEISQRIAEKIEPEKMFRITNRSAKPYEGMISGQTFKIMRIIGYRNPYRPVIIGLITEGTDHTTIKVHMRLSVSVKIFLCIFSTIIVIAGLLFVLQAFSSEGFNAALFIPPGMLWFMFFLTSRFFKYERYISKQDLQVIFGARDPIKQ
jgi:hypothetical protein